MKINLEQLKPKLNYKELCDAYIVLKKDEVDRLANKSVDEIREYYLPFI